MNLASAKPLAGIRVLDFSTIDWYGYRGQVNCT
jgi:hypothetical protein